MENELQNLNHMRDILDHMHKIGGEWYKELVTLKKENDDLKKENTRLDGLEKLITERINSLHANIDDKSHLVLNKISEVHTKDIPAVQNEIVKTRNSISPLTEAKRFYDEKLDILNKKQIELDNREKAVSQGERDLRDKQDKLSIRQGQLDDWQRNLEPRKNELDERENSLNEREEKLNEREQILDKREYYHSQEECNYINYNQEWRQPDQDNSPTETNDNSPESSQNNGQVKVDVSNI